MALLICAPIDSFAEVGPSQMTLGDLRRSCADPAAESRSECEFFILGVVDRAPGLGSKNFGRPTLYCARSFR
jgi:hypothetical protein